MKKIYREKATSDRKDEAMIAKLCKENRLFSDAEKVNFFFAIGIHDELAKEASENFCESLISSKDMSEILHRRVIESSAILDITRARLDYLAEIQRDIDSAIAFDKDLNEQFYQELDITTERVVYASIQEENAATIAYNTKYYETHKPLVATYKQAQKKFTAILAEYDVQRAEIILMVNGCNIDKKTAISRLKLQKCVKLIIKMKRLFTSEVFSSRHKLQKCVKLLIEMKRLQK